MNKLMDYLYWRSDISFEESHLNSLDICLFTQISLINFNGIINNDDKEISIAEAYLRYTTHKSFDKPLGLLIPNEIRETFKIMAYSKRYRNLKLSHLDYCFDKSVPVQYQAFLIKIKPNLGLVVFAATDDSLCGWYEDLKMVSGSPKGYELGYNYVNKLLNETNLNLYLCGHSKGGGIAIYTTLNTDNKHILKAFNFDGPGLIDEKFFTPMYQTRWNKICSYMPYNSSVGRLFDNNGRIKVVECYANILFQHNVYEWLVFTSDFNLTKDFGKESYYLKIKTNRLINKLQDKNELEFVISTLIKWLESTNNLSLTELKDNKKVIISSLRNLSTQERRLIFDKVLRYFLSDPKFQKLSFDYLTKAHTFSLTKRELEAYKKELNK